MQKLIQFIIALKNRQISRAQYRQIKRWLENPSVAKSASLKLMHSELGLHLDKKQGAKILELGCGPGKYVAMLSSLGFEVIGIDPFSFEATWSIIEKKKDIKFVSDIKAEELPFECQSFDHVVCLGALLYFKDPIKAMHEIRRVIKPGGALVLRTVNASNLYTSHTGKKLDPSSENLYKMDELEKLISDSGFEIKTSFAYGLWPPIATDFYWYLQSVWMPDIIQDSLSLFIRPEHRVNNTVISIAK